MLKSVVLGAILGGLTAFLWSFISWDLLPWHEKQLRSFQNEDEVIAVIASHAPVSGNYLLPTGPSQEGMNPDQKKAAEEIRMQKMQKGPPGFARKASARFRKCCLPSCSARCSPRYCLAGCSCRPAD